MVAAGLKLVSTDLLTNIIVRDKSEAKAVLKILERNPDDVIVTKDILIKAIKGDKQLQDSVPNIANLDGKANLFELLEFLGSSRPNIAQIGSHKLLNIRSLNDRIYWTVSTEGSLRSGLPAMIEFYSRGGTEEELNSSSVMPFRNRMNGSDSEFTFPPGEVKRVSGLQVKNLIRSATTSPIFEIRRKTALLPD